jgi:hypothetical protein
MKYTSINSVFKTLAAACALLLGASTLTAAIANFSGLIENPSDGGAGPGIWYSDSNNSDFNTMGSDDNGLRHFGRLEKQRPDYFGNPTLAFALRDGESGGSGITGAGDTTYLTGKTSTAVLTFQTPSAFTANASILGRRPSGSVAGEPKFEIYLLSSGVLRLTTGDTQFGVNTNLSTLQTDTWYYMAVTWDLDLSSDQVSWYLGEMGSDVLNSGNVNNVTIVGDPDGAIRIAGRSTSDIFSGSLQNVALYDRPLSAGAIQDQFTAIPEPSVYAGVVGLLALLMVYRRRKVN